MPSISEDIQAAAREVSSTPAPAPAPGPTPAPAAAEASAQPAPSASPASEMGRARDEHGRFAPKAGDKPAQEATPAPPNGQEKPAEAPQPAKAKRPPPQSWRPTLHGKWDSLPEDVQEEAHRLHTEASKALQGTAEARKTAERWQKTLEPFAKQIPGDPVQFVGNLLPAAITLQHGPPQQKAAVVAQLMKSFGVSEQDLVAALDGKAPAFAPQQPPQQAAPPEYRDPRVDMLLQNLQQQQIQQFVSSLGEDSKFLDEPMPDGSGAIRDAMADYIDFKAARGVEVTLKQAYDYVVAGHPTVTEALKQRQEAKAQAERSALTAKAQAAASSVRSEPVVVASARKGGSIVDDVMASAAALSNR
jgi:hypothetical protein